MRSLRRVIAGTVVGAFLPIGVHALTYDVMIRPSDITLHPATFYSGDRVRVYATVRNVGDHDVQGNVFFSENGTAIGTPPPFSVKARGAEEEVWVDWQPATTGDRQIFVRIVTAPETRDEDATNNEMFIPVSVQAYAPPPPPVAVPPPSSGGAVSGGTASIPSASVPAASPAPAAGAPAPAKRMERTTARTAPRPSPAAIKPAPPKAAIVPAAANAPFPEPTAPPTPPAPKEPYDAQLRQLLGTNASPWRSVVPIAAGIVALGGMIALAFLLIRRRSDDHPDHGTPPPQVDRRSRRSS